MVAPPATTTTTTVRTFDSLAVQRQLLVAPKMIAAPGTAAIPVVPAPVPVVEPAPGDVIKTTKTTTTVETPGRPTRIYETERNVVVVQDQGQTRELPYVTVPVLFVKETAELLDAESRAALDQMAGVIRTVIAAEPTAVFDIEGHTSAEGTPEFNMALSVSRAQRVFDELTQRYAVPANVLSAHGYGASYAKYPNGTEPELQLDRRVLIVRTR